MRTGLFIALILFILASFFPRQLLGLFTTDQTIIEAGMSYLTIIRFTYFSLPLLRYCWNTSVCGDRRDCICPVCNDVGDQLYH